MSSNEEDYNDNDTQAAKKRRIQRACDVCRRKKIRCDGGQMPGHRCSNCIAYNFECTYVEAAKKRGPPKGYVERLESRVEKLEKVLTKLYPDSDILKDLDSIVDTDAWLVEYLPRMAVKKPDETLVMTARHPTEIATSVLRKVTQPVEFQPDDELPNIMLAESLRQLKLSDHDKNRFFGKSSGAMLVQTAMELKNEYTGDRRPILGSKRDEFWDMRPWECITEDAPKATFVFPDDDLIAVLVDLYFAKLNILLPLLHRPTFQKLLDEKLHLRDDSFAVVLLLVCAIGSRFSDDPRCLLDGVDDLDSGGWKWYYQVQRVRKSVLMPHNLFDLQYYCLSVMFLQGSTTAQQQCWSLIGIGIRMLQDIGAHRRKAGTTLNNLTVEDELTKRVFCFDVDFPVECDDEYWEHPDPSKRFKQPPNTPSYVTGFVLHLKLHQVLMVVLRTIFTNACEVRWDPNRENDIFFSQSVSLYCTYYYIQILIHRSFIPSPRQQPRLTFPSLAICTNAARSGCHIVDVAGRRGLVALPHLQMAAFTCGIVLLLNMWNSKRLGLSIDLKKEINDINKCMQTLRRAEARWATAGRLWDIMFELASVGDLPLPKSSPPAHSNKRDRGVDSPTSSVAQTSHSSASTPEVAPRVIAGSRRAAVKTSQLHSPVQESLPPLPLPVYSNELGSLPVNGQTQYLASPGSSIPQQNFGFWPHNGMMGTNNGPSVAPPFQTAPAPIPGDMDLYNQIGLNYDSVFAPPSMPMDMGVFGAGDPAMGLQQPLGNMPDQAQFCGIGPGPNLQELIDSDSVTMWSNPPSGYDLDDWNTYLTNVSELTHGMTHPPPA
ncbi:hypothetical protein H0H92_001427 [Tricholoma furcatifolium]|nr:hypothetical protein H0H92_001427 [Tricholoma furcatifolium]